MNFRQLRKLNETRQKTVANALEVSRISIANYESGKRQPKIEQIPRIAEVLNCTIEQVVLSLIETKNQAREVER